MLAEPPPPSDRSALLLDLGMAEASAGLAGWPEHLQEAVDAAPNAAAAADAQPGCWRSRSAARSASRRRSRFSIARVVRSMPATAELALQLEAAAVVAGMNDPATAPSLASRREALRERAAADPRRRAELLAAAAFISVLSERARRGRRRARDPGACWRTRARRRARTAGRGSRPRRGFAARRSRCSGPSGMRRCGRCSMPRSQQARATGDSSRLAVGLANRGWLALRRGDLSAAEGDARTALAATELPAPPMYRVLNGGVLVKALVDQGELDAAEQALAPLDSEAESGSLDRRSPSPRPRPAAESNRDESPKGSRTSWRSAQS